MRFKIYLDEARRPPPMLELITDENEILAWITSMSLEHCYIDAKGIVTANENVRLYKKKLKYIPVQFGKTNWNFTCSENYLYSLRGAPPQCETFSCTDNHLSSLEFSPKIVRGSFYFNHNKITSLEGCPHTVSKDFGGLHNPITTLENISTYIKKIGGVLYLPFEQIVSGGIGILLIENLTDISCGADKSTALPKPFQIIKKYLGKPDDIFECQAELIDAGFEAFAKL